MESCRRLAMAAWPARFPTAMAAAVAAGYATVGTDTGHVGNNADFIPGHPEKLIDFAYRAIHEMTVAAKAVVPAFYGSPRRGSRISMDVRRAADKGITSAQRYPQDFDGIVAGASAWNSMRMHAARLAVNRMMNRAPGERDSCVEVSDDSRGRAAGMRRPRWREGRRHREPTKCTFDPQVLACKAGRQPVVPDCAAGSVGESDALSGEAPCNRRGAVRGPSLAGG